MQIVTKNLSYVYSEKSKSLAVKALDDISVTINEGEFFGIVGHTGSGKSTFVQHLNGLIRIGKNKGSIIIGEYDLSNKKCKMKELRAKVGMVFQYPEYQLFAETVKDDVAFGVKNFYPEKSNEDVEALVRSALELVGLPYEDIKDKSPFELSGGQKRRVAIAGVIASRPEILVLDEPVAGLDPQGKREFLSLLHKLKERVVKTVIIVSHDMNVVAENCNRVAVFKDGKIFALGTPKEIFSDSQKITEADLDLPLTAYLTKALAEKGINVDNDYTEKDFVKAVVNGKKQGGRL